MMDPLTALGLAGNIVQFVDFGLKLFRTSTEIAASTKGATALNLELEHAYTTLRRFTSKLKAAHDSEFDVHPSSHADAVVDELRKAHTEATRPHIVAIQNISVDCQVVCDELLNVVGGLHVNPTSSTRRLKNLAVALKTAFSVKKIASLEESLKRYQRLLALHFLPLLSTRQAYMTRVLEHLKTQSSRLELQQSNKFKELSDQLNVLLHKVQALSSNDSPGTDGGKRKGHKPHSFATDTTKTATVRSERNGNTLFRPEDVENLGEILNGLSLAEKDITVAAKVQNLLKSLHFKTRNNRYEAIPEAHRATFEWIFSDQKHAGSLDTGLDSGTDDTTEAKSKTAKPLSFAAWLESGSGTFWISGKAGAGKSTLMKFVANHAKTQQLLQNRAGTKKVIVASHYFWSAGTPMQKSLKGLVQELVFDILCHCPELALDVFSYRLQRPDPWTISTNFASMEDEWTVRELHQALLQMANHPSLPIQCCFFIDGLDEYSGDHLELCDILKDLATSDNVQCCVSGRPWNVFEDAFGSSSGVGAAFLRVHELTYNDIRLFAHSRLQSITRWKEMGITPDQVQRLVGYITEHAQGVFLWVFLVTKSLREGVTDGDTFDDLQRRLKAIPTALEPYFKQMLDRVDTVHHRYMAHALQVTLYKFGRLELGVLYVLENELEDANYALERSPDFNVWCVNLHPEFYRPCRRRINARCGGLLDINKNGVGFIHRTVYDFLRTGTMQDYLQSKAAPGFKPRVAALKAHFYLFRCVVRTLATANGNASADYMCKLWDACTTYGGLAFLEDEETATHILDAMADVQRDEPSDKSSFLQETIGKMINEIVCFKSEPVKMTHRTRSKALLEKHSLVGPGDVAPPGLRHTYLSSNPTQWYVLAKLQNNPSYFDSHRVSLLGTLLLHRFATTSTRANNLALLLEKGCDPNESIQSEDTSPLASPWYLFVSKLSWRYPYQLYTSFLRHGASRARLVQLRPGVTVCAVYCFLNAYLGSPERPYLGNTKPIIKETTPQQVFETVDVFLDTSPDNNRMQLEDILRYFQTWKKFPPRHVSEDERLATIAFVDKMILMAIDICVPVDVFCSLIANETIRKHVSPDVLTTMESYISSEGKTAHGFLLYPAETDLKRQIVDTNDEESGHDAKRPKVRSSGSD